MATKAIQVAISGKVNAIYEPGGPTWPTDLARQHGYEEGSITDDVLLNLAVQSAMNHAGALVRSRIENEKVDGATINVHIH